MGNSIERSEYLSLQKLVDERIIHYFNEIGISPNYIKQQIESLTQLDQHIKDITISELAEQNLDAESIRNLITTEIESKVPPVFLGCTKWYDGTSGLVPAPKQATNQLFLSSNGEWEKIVLPQTYKDPKTDKGTVINKSDSNRNRL